MGTPFTEALNSLFTVLHGHTVGGLYTPAWWCFSGDWSSTPVASSQGDQWESGLCQETAQHMKWLCSFLGIFLSRCWHRWMSSGGHNVLSCDETPPLEHQRPEQVWDGGVRGVNDMSSVDIGSLCVLSPPVNIPASQIFRKHSIKPRIDSHT